VEADTDVLELVRLPGKCRRNRGHLTVNIEPSLAAGMVGGLTYLEHYPYECVEQTVSRFLPNVVTYQAFQTLDIARPDLDAKLPQQVGVGLQRIYAKQNIDGGWGWWEKDDSNATVSAYVLFGLARAQQADFTVTTPRSSRGQREYLRGTLVAAEELTNWQLNRQAFTLYALAEAGQGAEPGGRALRAARAAEQLRQGVPRTGHRPDRR
jgi:alpha-2-macroglobulin